MKEKPLPSKRKRLLKKLELNSKNAFASSISWILGLLLFVVLLIMVFK